MRIYTVHTLAWSATADSDAVFVKEGFSWLALLFGPFWALWHGLWLSALALFLIGAVIGAAGEYSGLAQDAGAVLQFAVQFLFALWANDLRRWKLGRQGYIERGVASGRRVADAERRFFAGAAG